MSEMDKSKLILYLQELLEEQKRQTEEQREIALKERERADLLMAKLDDMNKQFAEFIKLMKAREKENARLKDQLDKVLKANIGFSEQKAL